MSGDAAPAGRRVKLYVLNDEGQWEDQGTGNVYIISDDSEHFITVKSEEIEDEDGKPKAILTTRISQDDIYQQQQDTLIVWNDPWLEQEMAVSFQMAPGCMQIWNEIQAIQGKAVSSADSDLSFSEDCGNVKLPEPSISSLVDIYAALLNPNLSRNAVATLLLSDGYLDKLFDVFEQCEDLEEVESLHRLFDIFKTIVLLNHPQLLRKLFAEEYMMRLMGVLEYDPELPSKQNHRQFLQQIVVFKELIALSVEVKQRIHQLYRMQYLKDTVLPRVLDDAVFATINNFVLQTQSDIVHTLYSDKGFLKQLFDRFEEERDDQRSCELIAFCQEMVVLAKCLSLSLKSEFYITLCGFGLFNVLGNFLTHQNQKARLAAVDILLQAAHQEPRVIRGYILSDEQRAQDNRFLRNLVMAVVHNPDESMKGQMVDILKVLLNAGVEDTTKVPGLSEFLHIFYGGTPSIMELLANPILHPQPNQTSTQYHVLDLFASFVNAHPERMKRFIMQSHLISKAVALLQPDTPAHLQCAVVRFINAVVSRCNDQYNQYIVRQNCLAPLVDLFLSNGPTKYNLVNSAILSIFEFVRKENIKKLVMYVVEEFPKLFEASGALEPLVGLQQKYEHHKHREQNGAQVEVQVTRQTAAPYNDLRDDEDEEYFNLDTTPQNPPEPSETVETVETPERKAPPTRQPTDDEEESCSLLSRAKAKAAPRPSPSKEVQPRPLKVRRLDTGDDDTADAEDKEEEAAEEAGEKETGGEAEESMSPAAPEETEDANGPAIEMEMETGDTPEEPQDTPMDINESPEDTESTPDQTPLVPEQEVDSLEQSSELREQEPEPELPEQEPEPEPPTQPPVIVDQVPS